MLRFKIEFKPDLLGDHWHLYQKTWYGWKFLDSDRDRSVLERHIELMKCGPIYY